LRNVLGLSDDDIAALERDEVIGTAASLPKPKTKKPTSAAG